MKFDKKLLRRIGTASFNDGEKNRTKIRMRSRWMRKLERTTCWPVLKLLNL